MRKRAKVPLKHSSMPPMYPAYGNLIPHPSPSPTQHRHILGIMGVAFTHTYTAVFAQSWWFHN